MRQIPTEIFGPDPGQTWCYYFQKADLARQYQDWSKIVDLWEEARQQGIRPAHGRELLPFIDGFARSGDWSTASELTHEAIDLTPKLRAQLCTAWKTIRSQTNASPARDQVMPQIQENLGCDLSAIP